MSERNTTDHAAHDRILIAAWAAGDLSADDHTRAESLAAACPGCGQLAHDLRTIAAATASLPTPSRPRDFTLRPEDAERARRRSWRSWLRLLGGPRFDVARPIAVGFTTLGIAGLLVANVPSMGGPGGTLSASGQREITEMDNQAMPSAAPEGRPVPVYGAGGGAGGSGVPEGPAAPGAAGDAGEDLADGDDDRNANAVRDPRAASPLAVLSGSFLILGLGLFGLRWTARRLGDG